MVSASTRLQKVVVVDEVHQIADSGRGYVLELLITKLYFILLHTAATLRWLA